MKGLSTAERETWVAEMVRWCRREIKLGLNRGMSLPFGSLIAREPLYFEEVKVQIFEELAKPGDSGLGEVPGVKGAINRRGSDLYFVAYPLEEEEGVSQQAPPDPLLVTGKLCLTDRDARLVALKLIEEGELHPADERLESEVLGVFAGYTLLRVAPDAVSLQITEIRRLMRLPVQTLYGL